MKVDGLKEYTFGYGLKDSLSAQTVAKSFLQKIFNPHLMTIKTFIEKAIQGGWKPYGLAVIGNIPIGYGHILTYYRGILLVVLLDPEAWKAVGTVEGWPDGETARDDTHGCSWRVNMHRMIDALAEGKTIEQYLETL